MNVSKMIFAVCVSVLLLSQLVMTNPLRNDDDNDLEYVTGSEVELANEMSRALIKFMADINRHTNKRSRSRRYIAFRIGADYKHQSPHRRPHHHRPHHYPALNSHGGNQLVSQ